MISSVPQTIHMKHSNYPHLCSDPSPDFSCCRTFPRYWTLSHTKLYPTPPPPTTKDHQLYHKLIRQTTQSQANAIMVNDVLITDQDQAAAEWANYYEDLATPKEKSIWDADFLCSAEQQLQGAHHYARSHQSQPSISYHEVTQAVKTLNSGKAVHLDGVRAEHLKAAPTTIIPVLAILFSDLIRLGAPPSMKTGKKIPLAKKGKSNIIMSNHRCITITSTLGKTYDYILKSKIGPLPQSALQFGFTEGHCPQMAALCLTESISEAKATGPPW